MSRKNNTMKTSKTIKLKSKNKPSLNNINLQYLIDIGEDKIIRTTASDYFDQSYHC